LIYLKSFAVGAFSVIGAIVLTAVSVMIYLAVLSRDLPANETYSWDPISFFRGSIAIWIVLLLVFLFGFGWEYRRLAAQR
jgi:hypothetical protein